MQWRLLKIKDIYIYNYFRHIKCVFLIYKMFLEMREGKERGREGERERYR